MDKTQLQETAGKPIRCKAAICRKAGEALVIEEVEVAPPKPYEVRIKIICTSLCHTDVTFWKMEPMGIFPRIFGHEAVGVVESVGDYVEEVKEGDRVIPVPLPNCGECIDCKSEKSNMCKYYSFGLPAHGMLRGGISRFTDTRNREVVHNFFGVSSFAEYTVVDVMNVVKISTEIPPNKACLLGCGVSTGVCAAWKVADVQKGSTVAVFGLGTVGFAVAEGARHRGASKIIGIDINPKKFDIGKKFGLTDFINPKDIKGKQLNEVIKEKTNGGVDYCFECVGLTSLVEEAFKSSRLGWGKTIILGLETKGVPLSVNTQEMLGGKSIMGSVLGGTKPKSDIPQLVKCYLDKELCFDEIVSHEVCFKDINKAFELIIQGDSLRCIIWMDQ